MRFWTQKMAASLVDCHNLFTAKVLGDLIPGGGPLLWLLWCDICGNPPTAWDTWQSQMSWEYSEKSLKGYFWSTCLWWSSWPALQVNNHLFKVLSSLPRGLTRGIFLDIWVRTTPKSILVLCWYGYWGHVINILTPGSDFLRACDRWRDCSRIWEADCFTVPY